MLSSSARRDDDVLQTTQPGDALQLFADATAPPAPSPALAAFTTTAAARRESRHDRRERLRDERRTLVAAVARRTGEAHRAIHARVNRATGAGSVTAASASSSSAATGCSSANSANVAAWPTTGSTPSPQSSSTIWR